MPLYFWRFKMSCPSAKSSGSLGLGTTTVVSRKTRLNSVSVISDGTNAATVIVYDNTAASGTILARMNAGTTMASIVFQNPVQASVGLTVVVSGVGATAVITYDA